MTVRLREIWAWLWRPRPVPPTAKCPECGRPIVAAPEWGGDRILGPIGARRTRAELLANCPVHGRRPQNNASRSLNEPDK